MTPHTHFNEGHEGETLTSIAPQPISVPDTDSTPDDSRPSSSSSVYNRLTKITPYLQTVQKYSSITFSVFVAIHGIGVVFAPVVSTSLSNELISIGREVYQSSGVEEWLVWGSLTLHVVSGVGLRYIRTLIRKWNYGDSKPRKRVTNLTSIHTDPNQEIKNEDEVGLIGGIPSYFGLGAKRSFSFKSLGLSPLQFSGYLLVPIVLYHSLQTRILPLFLEGDSAYVNIEYISYLLNHSTFSSVVNWIVYPALSILTIYHTVFGFLRWNGVKNLKIRKFSAHLINLLSAVAFYSVYKISKTSNLLSVPPFVLKRFEYYLSYLYL